MPLLGTRKAHRVPVMMTDQQFTILSRIRENNPEYNSNSAVIVAAIVRMARAEGVLIG